MSTTCLRGLFAAPPPAARRRSLIALLCLALTMLGCVGLDWGWAVALVGRVELIDNIVWGKKRRQADKREQVFKWIALHCAVGTVQYHVRANTRWSLRTRARGGGDVWAFVVVAVAAVGGDAGGVGGQLPGGWRLADSGCWWIGGG